MAETVLIKEVAARDGLQAQPQHLTVAQRLDLLAALAKTGVPELEIGSFVSPKAIVFFITSAEPSEEKSFQKC
jgi:hydroxymethylglutaryl-CoA lyase